MFVLNPFFFASGGSFLSLCVLLHLIALRLSLKVVFFRISMRPGLVNFRTSTLLFWNCCRDKISSSKKIIKTLVVMTTISKQEYVQDPLNISIDLLPPGNRIAAG
jgi:hypothetical protein